MENKDFQYKKITDLKTGEFFKWNLNGKRLSLAFKLWKDNGTLKVVSCKPNGIYQTRYVSPDKIVLVYL